MSDLFGNHIVGFPEAAQITPCCEMEIKACPLYPSEMKFPVNFL